ncbi:MAG: hypothetical protein LBH35_05270 [Treponema sp.]|nr:hypothetical protein [Treponema sp.]
MTNLPEKLQLLFTRRSVRALSAVLCGLAVLAAAFFSRRPVVLVTDSAFTALYGKNRAGVKRLVLSARLFRRLKTAVVAESAGPDLVSLAARTASKRPYAVFFPYRYRDGARRYLRDYPGAPAAVLAGRETGPETGRGQEAVSSGPPDAPAWYSTDVLTDLYRGGFCAGLLAPPPGEISVFQANPLDAEQRSALLRGLEESAGPETASRVRFTGGDFSKEAVCAIVIGGGEAFFRETAGIPFVLYSWIDPAAAPAEAEVLFSDSPWEVLPEALKLLETGQFEGLVPSTPLVLGSKPANISAGRIKQLFFLPEIADNEVTDN